MRIGMDVVAGRRLRTRPSFLASVDGDFINRFGFWYLLAQDPGETVCFWILGKRQALCILGFAATCCFYWSFGRKPYPWVTLSIAVCSGFGEDHCGSGPETSSQAT